jgi:hypothetical protein
MYPDATTSAVQIGTLNPRQQGTLMNWKRLFSSLLWNSLWFAAFFSAIFGIEGVLHPRPLQSFAYLFVVISVSFHNEGIHKLKSEGHIKFLRIYGAFLTLFIISFFVFAVLGLLHGVFSLTAMSVTLALCVPTVPLTLFLNRKNGTPTSQPATDNAS